MALSHDEVREILAIIDAAGLAELRVETAGFSLHVRLGEAANGASGPPATRPEPAPEVASEGEPAPEVEPAPAGDGAHTIESPMLGTFYRAEAPGASPFVEIGTEVEADTVVCIIEVMKMMNSITAGVAGRIVEICPDNGRLVEFGEPLFRVEPA